MVAALQPLRPFALYSRRIYTHSFTDHMVTTKLRRLVWLNPLLRLPLCLRTQSSTHRALAEDDAGLTHKNASSEADGDAADTDASLEKIYQGSACDLCSIEQLTKTPSEQETGLEEQASPDPTPTTLMGCKTVRGRRRGPGGRCQGPSRWGRQHRKKPWKKRNTMSGSSNGRES